MRTLTGMYRAVCLGADTDSLSVRCQVPQIFAEETVTCLDIIGSLPAEGTVGWVSFESGVPDRPIWMSGLGGGVDSVLDEVFVGNDDPGIKKDGYEIWYDPDAVPDTSGGAFVTRGYRWSTNTARTDPGHGIVKVNNLNPAIATEMYISVYDLGDIAFLTILQMKPGDFIDVYLNGDVSTRIEYTLRAPFVNNGGQWLLVPVSVVANYGFATGTPSNNAQVNVSITNTSNTGAVGPGVAAGGTTGQTLTKKSDTDYDTQWTTPVTGNFLPIAGGTMTGLIQATTGEAIRFPHAGDYIDWFNGGSRIGYLQGNAGGLLLNSESGALSLGSAGGYVTFPNNSRVGTQTAYGGGYSGLGWSNGQYLIMSDATNTFVSTPSNGTLFMRAGTNGGYQLALNASGNHTITGNLNYQGYSIDGINIATSNGFNLNGTNSFYFASYGGGWYMTDSSYIRATNDKHVWLGGGWFACNGAISVGWGGVNWRGYNLDINGPAYFGDGNTGHMTTRDGYRYTSNGSWDGWYYNAGFLTQKGSGGDRADYGIHPGGVAYNWGATSASPGLACWNLNSSGVSPIYAADFVYNSTRQSKQDIVAWPPKSVGAAALGAVDRLRLLEVVQYRKKRELALLVALPERRALAFARLNAYRERQGLEPHPWPLHDCDNHPWCDGTSVSPCSLVRNWENPTIGVVIEDVANVLPEAVQIDADGDPEALRSTAMIGFLLAVCQEQQERIEQLEVRMGWEAAA